MGGYFYVKYICPFLCEITWAPAIFFCQLPYCVDAIMAAQVTQELVCVLSECELVCIVCVCMYGWPLHCTILSSILFFWEFSCDCHMRKSEKICYFSVLRLTFSDLSVVKNRFCCLFSVFTFLFRNCGSMMWDG